MQKWCHHILLLSRPAPTQLFTILLALSACNREHITAEKTEVQSQAELKSTLETSLCDRLLESL